MPRQRTVKKSYTLPSNPKFVTINHTDSDGDLSRYNLHSSEHVDNLGDVDYYAHVTPDSGDSSGTLDRWRHEIGQKIGALLGDQKDQTRYVLKDLPEGYQMYVRHKGSAEKPRQDVYVYGAYKFRSIPEFIPHALWLYNGKREFCTCQYCGKSGSPRKPAPQSRGKHGATQQAPSPTKSHDSVSHLYAKVQKAPLTVNRLFRVPCKDRDTDVRGANSTHESHERRWFREDELVWVELQPPIVEPGTSPDDCIRFWPGLIENFRYKPLTVAHDEGTDGVRRAITPSWTYSVRLLAVSKRCSDISGLQILPYLAYRLPQSLDEVQAKFLLQGSDFRREKLMQFDPRPPVVSDVPRPTLQDAMPAFALAINIARSICSFYCVTDDFEAQCVLPLPEKAPRLELNIHSETTSVAGSSSLADTMNMANSANYELNMAAASHTLSNVIKPPLLGLGTSNSSRPAPAPASASRVVQKLSKTVIDSTRSSVSKQVRFQGLWWGAERIWTDDLIRLKLPRKCLAPSGTEDILPPAGPSKTARDKALVKSIDPTEYGAGNRGVLMRINAFLIAEMETNGKVFKECRVSGTLYELVQKDWTDDSTIPMEDQSPSTSFGKPNHILDGQFNTNSSELAAHLRPNILPLPPSGYKFRPILKDGDEAILSLALIAGRYYPRILEHPLLRRRVVGEDATNFVYSLEGYSGGFEADLNPCKCKASREKMLSEADRAGRAEGSRSREESVQNQDEEEVDELLSENETPPRDSAEPTELPLFLGSDSMDVDDEP